MTLRTPAEVLAESEDMQEIRRGLELPSEPLSDDDLVEITLGELRAWAAPWRDSHTDPPEPSDDWIIVTLGDEGRTAVATRNVVREWPDLYPYWMPLPEPKR